MAGVSLDRARQLAQLSLEEGPDVPAAVVHLTTQPLLELSAGVLATAGQTKGRGDHQSGCQATSPTRPAGRQRLA